MRLLGQNLTDEQLEMVSDGRAYRKMVIGLALADSILFVLVGVLLIVGHPVTLMVSGVLIALGYVLALIAVIGHHQVLTGKRTVYYAFLNTSSPAFNWPFGSETGPYTFVLFGTMIMTLATGIISGQWIFVLFLAGLIAINQYAVYQRALITQRDLGMVR